MLLRRRPIKGRSTIKEITIHIEAELNNEKL
jgi:hypothetical protein